MQPGLFICILPREAEVVGNGRGRVDGRLPKGAVAGLPDDCARFVRQPLRRSQVVVVVVIVISILYLELGIGPPDAVRQPAVAFLQVPRGIVFADQPFVGVDETGGGAVDCFANPAAEGVVGVGCRAAVGQVYLYQPVADVVVIGRGLAVYGFCQCVAVLVVGVTGRGRCQQFVVAVVAVAAVGPVAGPVVAEAFAAGAGQMVGAVVAVVRCDAVGGSLGNVPDVVEAVLAACQGGGVLLGLDGAEPAVGVVAEVSGYAIGQRSAW